MSGEAKAWTICVVSICITAITISVLSSVTSITNHRNAFKEGLQEITVPYSIDYHKQWVKVAAIQGESSQTFVQQSLPAAGSKQPLASGTLETSGSE